MNYIKIWRSDNNIFANYKTQDFVWVIVTQHWGANPYIIKSDREDRPYECAFGVKNISIALRALDFKWEGWNNSTVFKNGEEVAARQLLQALYNEYKPRPRIVVL